jgi:hypothetical protein
VFAGRASARERSRRGRRTALKRTAKPSGPGARGWRQVGGDGSNPTGSRSIANSPAMEARRIRLQGEPGISRQPTAQGTPECSDCTCMLVCVFLRTVCTRDRGCSKHPAFPAPSSLGRNELARPGRNAPRECGGVFTRHRPRRRTIQYSRDGSDQTRGLGVLGTQPPRGTTG